MPVVVIDRVYVPAWTQVAVILLVVVTLWAGVRLAARRSPRSKTRHGLVRTFAATAASVHTLAESDSRPKPKETASPSRGDSDSWSGRLWVSGGQGIPRDDGLVRAGEHMSDAGYGFLDRVAIDLGTDAGGRVLQLLRRRRRQGQGHGEQRE